MRSDPSTMRTLSGGNPPSSGFSHVTWPRSISTAASDASVETSSAPAGVTCCQRMSPRVFRVHTAVAPDGAGAACAWAAVQAATSSDSMRSVRRAEAATMTILGWEGAPISPQRGLERKSGAVKLVFPFQS